jgi:hypothetical protein
VASSRSRPTRTERRRQPSRGDRDDLNGLDHRGTSDIGGVVVELRASTPRLLKTFYDNR